MTALLSPRVWLALIFAGLVAAAWFEHMRAELAGEKAENAELQLQAYGASVAHQNLAIEAYAKAGEEARKQGARAKALADAAAGAAQAEIDALRARQAAPTPAGATCTEAFDEIRGVAKPPGGTIR